MTTATTQAPAGAPVRWEALLGASGRIPRAVAICPECSRTLHYQVTAADEDGTVEVDLDCWAPVRTRWGDWTHRYWQSDWQETVDKCRAWVKAHAPNQAFRGRATLWTVPCKALLEFLIRKARHERYTQNRCGRPVRLSDSD